MRFTHVPMQSQAVLTKHLQADSYDHTMTKYQTDGTDNSVIKNQIVFKWSWNVFKGR